MGDLFFLLLTLRSLTHHANIFLDPGVFQLCICIYLQLYIYFYMYNLIQKIYNYEKANAYLLRTPCYEHLNEHLDTNTLIRTPCYEHLFERRLRSPRPPRGAPQREVCLQLSVKVAAKVCTKVVVYICIYAYIHIYIYIHIYRYEYI